MVGYLGEEQKYPQEPTPKAYKPPSTGGVTGGF